MLEILRRFSLAAGTGISLWLFFWTPATLLCVRPADFSARMLEQPFLTPETTVESFRAEQMENRTLPPSLARDITLPATSAPLFYDASHPSVRSLTAALRDNFSRTKWLNAFITVAARDYEWILHDLPRSAQAPPASVYPHRLRSWIWLAGGLLFYFLLPRPSRRQPVCWDPRAAIILDLVFTAFAGACFAAPLALYPSTAASLQGLFTGTLWAWLAAAAILSSLALASYRTAWYARLDGRRLQVGSLFAKREYDLASLSRVEFLVRLEEPVGWRLHFSSAPPLDLLWFGRINWLSIHQALKSAAPSNFSVPAEHSDS
jgi:hypothetical protein